MAHLLARAGPSGVPPLMSSRFSAWVEERLNPSKDSRLEKLPHFREFRDFYTFTDLEHSATMDIDCSPCTEKLTHIICTIGPASRKVEMLVKLMKAGMNICRLNFSHGTYEYHAGTVQNIREAIKQMPDGFVCAIALDTKGPDIRTGLLEYDPNAEVLLETGKTITVTINDAFAEKCSDQTIWVDYKKIVGAMEVGGIIYIDYGLISLKVTGKTSDSLLCEILNGGKLGSKKSCNLPGIEIDLPAVSEKDRQDLQFGIDQDVDIVFASFIQNAAGVREIRKILGERGSHIKVVSKIESYAGLYNFNDILRESDGIMVARGDLGIEIPPEKVFIAQKMMIASCNVAGKPVICATQFLESMTHKPRATRSESNDVANAVLDGSDCVMLAAETAKGLYPVEAVTHMANICLEAEMMYFSLRQFRDLKSITPWFIEASHVVSLSAVDASYQSMATAILVLSSTGRTAHIMSCYKPRCPIVLVTRDEPVAKSSLLYRGVEPILYNKPVLEDRDDDLNARIEMALTRCFEKGVVKHNDNVVVVMGLTSGPGMSNCLQIVTCKHGKPM